MAARKVAGALALALLLGCGSASSDAAIGVVHDDVPVWVSSRQHVDVEVRPIGPIKQGKNTVSVGFPEHAHAELASASALMPAHGHGSPAPKIERSEDGTFMIRDLVLYMSGRWELRLTLRVDGCEDEAIALVDVP